MAYILALDQGTTSSRAIVFDRTGTPCGKGQREFRQHYPQPGWVEHDAEEIWESQLAVAHEALADAGVGAKDVAAIGITNQRETTVLWDRSTGKPVAPAIVWQDRRTAPFCDELRTGGHADTIRARTGLVVDPYFSGTKLHWLLDHVDGVRGRARRGELAFGTIDSWLVYRLTGGRAHVTDASNASRTLLMNIHDGDWDDALLGLMGVPRSLLPEIRPSSERYGTTAPGLFDAEIPISGMAGDQQAALFGQVCTRPGMAKNTYGTGCFLLMNTGEQAVTSANNLLTTVAWRIGNRTTYALEGSVFIGGAVVQWLRDGLGLIASARDVEPLARSVADTGGVYLVPAFVGLGAPHWDPYARGTIVGITRGTTSAHVARAALEAIAYQTLDVLRAMEADAGLSLAELRVDGGATANDLLMQFQADVLGTATLRPVVQETTALGAACLAGLAEGVWPDVDEIADLWQIDRRFEPGMEASLVEARVADWHRALERSRNWAQP